VTNFHQVAHFARMQCVHVFPSFPFLKMAESKGRNSGKQGNFTVCLLFGKYQIKQLPTPRNAEGKKTRAMSERLGRKILPLLQRPAARKGGEL